MAIFVKKFFGFHPEIIPVIPFRREGSRNSLLRKAKADDTILFVATNTEETHEDDREMILGMAQIGKTEADTIDCIADPNLLPEHFFDRKRDFKWPKAIPITKAWRFTPPIHKLEIFDNRSDSHKKRCNPANT